MPAITTEPPIASDDPVLDHLTDDDRTSVLDALRRHTEPMRIAVVGRERTGRDTVARAVRERFHVSPIGPGDDDAGDADAWIYVLVSGVRQEDREAISRLPADRTVVVLSKADTLGSWEEARAVARRCEAVVRRPVLALMPLLATALLRDDEFFFLRSLAAEGEQMPSMAGEFLTGGSDERAVRTRLLRRLDQFGIDLALTVLASAPEVDATRLAELLRGVSGIDELAELLSGLEEPVLALREDRLRRTLDRIAATDTGAREAIEELLAEWS
ncbi:hypothetical protein GCM10027169_01890 [Gordonia jinhuaensis]|uniref:Uncharacterized protein n=1 Tax=Gordonia jinhuaensis TaxID=1517702 RepID=A0A916T2I1_9ACTN|nr:hypothetical protein [Gordonia jinhuaensis]GGB28149.1 hypothetical protein GCM10011489_15420 [Gordonia jinhuaensis]